jgi:hypothetical protein
MNTTLKGEREIVFPDFLGLIEGSYARNGVIFACIMTRVSLFRQARFQWQQMRNSQPGNTFGTPELAVLDRPEPGQTTSDLLARAILDADIAGNWFGLRRPDRIKRLFPHWMTMVLGSKNTADLGLGGWDPDAELIGYSYIPGGIASGNPPIVFLPEEIAHWAPVPDPLAQYRGISWLTPILRETMADSAATAHKLAYFRNAATPNIAVTLPPTMTKDKASEWIDLFEQEHKGVLNAYRSIYFGGGASITPVGSSMQQMTFKDLQNSAETRITAAAGLHPVIVPFSEGLTGSSLNAGNFQQAARLVADKTLHPLWVGIAGALERVMVRPNPAARLWYDDDIPFLRTDVKDQADITQKYEQTITSYVVQGFTPDSAIDAVVSSDPTRLQHTGLVSVQLQPPGSTVPGEATTPQTAQAISEFWPTGGRFASVGNIRRGQELAPDHPVVRAFPDMFILAAAPIKENERVAIHCPGCQRFVGYSRTDPAAIGLEVQCRNCKKLVPLKGAAA